MTVPTRSTASAKASGSVLMMAVAFGVVLTAPSVALSQPAAQRARVTASLDSLLYASIDRWITAGLRRYEIAGAALAIVHQGAIVHREGFGFADIRRRYRVDPDTTEFHAASLTKIVSAVALLAVADSRHVSLDADARTVLPADVAAAVPAGVSLHHLLTHTSGLDSRWRGLSASDANHVDALASLAHALPEFIDPPGARVRYSNHGYGLVGLATEQMAGAPWASVIENTVLRPLGMQRSYVRSRDVPPSHAIPYRYRSDTTPEPYVFENVAPAGALHAPATDVARLVGALLDTSMSATIPPAVRAGVLTPQDSINGVRGYSYGLFEYPNTHQRALSMGGEVPGFSSRILLVPALQLGVVVMVNRKDPTLAIGVFDSLLARLPDGAPLGCPAGSGSIADGTYRSVAYEHDSFLRIGSLFGPFVTVAGSGRAKMRMLDPMQDAWVEVKRNPNGSYQAARGACIGGATIARTPTLTIATSSGPVSLEPVRWFEKQEVAICLFALGVMGAVGAGVRALLVIARSPTQSAARQRPIVDYMTIAAAVVTVTYAIAFVVGLYQLAIENDDRFAFAIPAWFSGALLLPYAIAALLVATIAVPSRWTVRRGIAALSATVLCVIVWNWRLLLT